MTSKELAKLIGVSQSTVSRALNGSGRISEKRRQEILSLAKEHHFEFNENARSLRTQQSHTIGILMPNYFRNFDENVYQSTLYSQLQRELSLYDHDPVLLFEKDMADSVEALDRCIKKRQLAGLIVSRKVTQPDMAQYLMALPVPVVSLVGGSGAPALPAAYVDSERGGALVGAHFAARGYRNFAVLTANVRRSSSEDKMRGFLRALEEAGLGLPQDHVLSGDYTFSSGFDAAARNLPLLRRCDALFAHNDAMALGAIDAMQRGGLRVPEDIAVVGSDDIPMASWFRPRLTTVHVPTGELARAGCAKLMACIRGEAAGADVRIEPTLALRESCP